MKNISEIMERIQLDDHLPLEDIPDIDLYMDQVIQLFEKKFADAKRDDDEKVLTKTMINNYAKGKLFYPIENKKYSKNHIMLIGMIYQLKGALSISDIKIMLNRLNKKTENDALYLEKIYERYVALSKHDASKLTQNMEKRTVEVAEAVHDLKDEEAHYLVQLLLAASFVNRSNLYRKAAEKIVDEMKTEKEADS